MYDWSSPAYSDAAGHFTQMVWVGTTQVGCAQTACPAGSLFDASYGISNYFVCKYWPPGNIVNAGEFAANVLES